MTDFVSQNNNNVTDGDIVARDKIVNNYSRQSKLGALFEKLKQEFVDNNRTEIISDNLSRFNTERDTIGLEQKLTIGNRLDLLEDGLWLKQEYAKKLTKFQFFEPAQEIHAFLLSIVLEKFRNIIYPMLNVNQTDMEVSKAISCEIVNPIVQIIQKEGCDDVMGLSSVDIDGMIYFMTGKCHIKWQRNDSIPSSV